MEAVCDSVMRPFIKSDFTLLSHHKCTKATKGSDVFVLFVTSFENWAWRWTEKARSRIIREIEPRSKPLRSWLDLLATLS